MGGKCLKPAQINKPDQTFSIGQVEQLYSDVLSETRTLNMYLPQDYAADSVYPVIYVIDGSADEDFIHIAGLVQYLHLMGANPNPILVGIANVDRRRYFTFPTTNAQDKIDFPTTGSSEKFIQYLKYEVQPLIEKKYHCANKTIIGQSPGGLLATEILFKYPDMFDRYLIVSPSLWWDDDSLLNNAGIFSQDISQKEIYIAAGAQEEQQMQDDAAMLSEIIQKRNNKNYFAIMPNQSHLTILHNCIYDALMYYYPVVEY